jgi:hypothetical protein
MTERRPAYLVIFVGLVTLCSCGSSGHISKVAGTVTIGGTPVVNGTIHFQSKTTSGSSGGAIVSDGKFQVVNRNEFETGEYAVALQAYRKTGRTINDPQKGKVEEMTSVPLTDSPQKVVLSQDNAKNLSLNYTALAK